MSEDRDLTLKVTQRERDTMLAALRLWQAWKDSAEDGLLDIATHGGAYDMLDDSEISELCEDINI